METVATSLVGEDALRFVLLGMATGSLTALVALGIVLVHRTSGVLNFSAGALGGIAAFFFYDIRDDGYPTWWALTFGLAVGVLLGLLTYAVLASLRNASQLSKLIATLGLFSAGQAFMVLRWGGGIVQPRSMLPSRLVTLWGDVTIGLDRLLLIGIALACAAVLRLVYSGTLFGLATSAVAENRRVAASAGWSPNRIELLNFAVAGGLSALAAILLAPIITLNFTTVVSWSNLKKLEEALLAIDPSDVASLDSRSVVEAIVDHPVERPEAAQYDFSENQLPEFPGLAGFRVFTREVAILEMEDGRYEVLSDGFVDMLDPPALG